MKNNPKNVKVPVIVILYLLAILFLGYGIYMAYDAVVYVNTYDTSAAVSATNMFQYVVAASASYFGFAIVIFAAAAILGALNQVQRNLYHTLVFDTASDVSPEIITGITPDANVADTISEETAVTAAELDDAVKEEKKEPESDEENKLPEPEDTLNAVEAPAEDMAEIQEADPDAKQDHITESESSIPIDDEPEIPEIPVQVDTEPEDETRPEETSAPLVKDFSSQFITETEQEPEPEIIAQQQPAPEIIAQQQPAPEIIAQQQPAPEIIAQQQPTPEVVIRKRPVPNQPAEPAPQQKPAPETVTEKPSAKPLPSTVPEEILQTKRKRGLKYETVAMDEKKRDADYPRNLTDTIRLKKEDRDAISSAFIRDIFEKNE